MADLNIVQVNIGTKEKPVFVPRVNIGTEQDPLFVPPQALLPNTPEGDEYWQMVASGSINLGEDQLDKMLSFMANNAKKS